MHNLSPTFWEERRFRIFDNMVLRRIFGPKRDEATGRWGLLHNVELPNLYSSGSIIRMTTSMRLRSAERAT
jgi:hypothetical protein